MDGFGSKDRACTINPPLTDLILSLSIGARMYGDAAVLALRGLLGDLAIQVQDITSDDKVLQYTTDLSARDIAI